MTTAVDGAAVLPRFKGEIIRKVYRVWLLRKLLPILFLEVGALSFLLSQLAKVAFVQRVVENALTILFAHPGRVPAFVLTTFTASSLGKEFLGVSILVVVALLVRHITQGMLRWVLVQVNYFGKV